MLTVLLSEEEIRKRIAELGKEIREDYRGKELMLLGILRGSVLFYADLSRHLDPYLTEFEFIQVNSYERDTSTGNVKLLKGLSADIKGKHVLIVEDIIDTGLSLEFILDYISQKSPASVKTCVFLNKNKIDLKADYTGFDIPNKFVIGYGLDDNGKCRNLNYVGVKS